MSRSTPPWGHLLPLRGPGADLDDATALVGAGASVDAGLPVAWTLFDEIVRSLVRRRWAVQELCHLARLPRPDAQDAHDFIRFETLLLWVGRIFDPALELFAFLDDFTTPGALHRRLAHATRRGLRLATVNFDDLLEQALVEQGDVPATIDAHARRRGRPAGVPVVKFHGTRVEHRNGRARNVGGSLHATTQVIAATNPGTFLNGTAVETLSRLVDGRTLIVVGYSASDDLDIVPALRASRPARVIWVDHHESAPRRASLGRTPRGGPPWRVLLASLQEAGVEVAVLRGRTSDAFDRLGLTLPATVPPPGRAPTPDWRAAVRRWARSVAAHDPTGLGMASLLFGELGRYELVERALAESRPSPSPDGRWTAARCSYERAQAALLQADTDPPLAYALGQQAKRQATGAANRRVAVLTELLLGRAAFLQQDYGNAELHLAQARDATPPGTTEWAYAVSWLGRTRLWSRRAGAPGPSRQGMAELGRAAAVFRRQGELEGLLDACEAAAVGHASLLELDRARSAFQEARDLAFALGFVDRRFTTECGLAECAQLAGASGEARRRVRDVLALVATSGNDEVADAWALLAEVELQDGRFRAAAAAARRALATTTIVNRYRICEHATTLAEALLLAHGPAAAARALREAAACEPQDVDALGRAKRAALRAALAPEARPSEPIAWRRLCPSDVLRLAGTVVRTGCDARGSLAVVRRAQELSRRAQASARA